MIDLSYTECNLCPFSCKVNRTKDEKGRCYSGSEMKIARIAPHYWEEPCLSGQTIEKDVKGSGAIFFTGCNLHCVFCQNSGISTRECNLGSVYTPDMLASEMLGFQENGVHNIDLVTPSHFLPDVIKSLEKAKNLGLTIPVIYNCSGYESEDAISALSGLIDIYMPDFKYFSAKLSSDYSHTKDYFEVTKKAVILMQKQTGKPVFDDMGFMKKGTLVRHLILPGSDSDSRKIISELHSLFSGDGIALSLMSQYTPSDNLPFPELTEKLPHSAYFRTLDFAEKLGFDYLYTQSFESASESYIPEFK